MCLILGYKSNTQMLTPPKNWKKIFFIKALLASWQQKFDMYAFLLVVNPRIQANFQVILGPASWIVS